MPHKGHLKSLAGIGTVGGAGSSDRVVPFKDFGLKDGFEWFGTIFGTKVESIVLLTDAVTADLAVCLPGSCSGVSALCLSDRTRRLMRDLFRICGLTPKATGEAEWAGNMSGTWEADLVRAT